MAYINSEDFIVVLQELHNVLANVAALLQAGSYLYECKDIVLVYKVLFFLLYYYF
ncbi:MAG: hypothetical protein ACI84O_001250 [Myxococcota bacterium]|jgi:hypothetical protein